MIVQVIGINLCKGLPDSKTLAPNPDCLGRRADSGYAYILVKDSLNRGLRKALYDANVSFINLKLDTHYEDPKYTSRRLMGSDQFPFYLKGVPFMRIDCGFCKDYHQPTDTPDKINYPLLTKQVQLAFLALWNMANNVPRIPIVSFYKQPLMRPIFLIVCFLRCIFCKPRTECQRLCK